MGVERVITRGVVVVAAATAFGATHHADTRERKQNDQSASDAIRRYIGALNNRADYLEEVAIVGRHWDPDKTVIDPGSDAEVRAACRDAAPCFHRLNIGEGERPAISNTMPEPGHQPMNGAGNFAERAQLLETVLNRCLVLSR